MLRRSIKKSTSSMHSASDKSGVSDHLTIDGEFPLAILKVQILGCTNLPAADLNGKSDPYVSLEFGGRKVKTTVIKNQLNPRWPAKDATFEFPIYSSAIKRTGAFFNMVVWDKDMIGKDYLGELSLQPTQWFKPKGDNGTTTVLSFSDPSNYPLNFPLANVRSRKPRPNDPKPDGPPSIQVKLGLLLPSHASPSAASAGTPTTTATTATTTTTTTDLTTAFESILTQIQSDAQSENEHIFARPPTQGFGTIRSLTKRLSRHGSGNWSAGGGATTSDSALSDASPQSSPISRRVRNVSSFGRPKSSSGSLNSGSKTLVAGAAVKKKKKRQEFRINWGGTMIDYDFSSKKAVVGILMLEVKKAVDLPKVKNFLRTGWEMDPFVVITHDSNVYRTKVVRHDLNPTFNDKFILFVKRAPASSPTEINLYTPLPSSKRVTFQISDWERRQSKDQKLAEGTLDISELIEKAPKADEETGLFNEEAMRLHLPEEKDVWLELADGGRWEAASEKEKSKGKGKGAGGAGGSGERRKVKVTISVKYDPHGALRQRFWRHHLKDYDLDHSGQYSYAEFSDILEKLGLDATPAQLQEFWKKCDKNPESDELTIEEAMRCLEGEFGTKREVLDEAKGEDGDQEDEEEVEAALLETVKEMEGGAGEDEEGGAVRRRSTEEGGHRGATTSMFGHSRESMYDLEAELREIFLKHPLVFEDEDGSRQTEGGERAEEEVGVEGKKAILHPLVPAKAIPDILATYSERHDGLTFLKDDEERELRKLLNELGEGTSIGPESLMTFIARATGVEESEGDGGASDGGKVGEGERVEFPSTSEDIPHPAGLESAQEFIEPVISAEASRSRSTTAESSATPLPSTPKTSSVLDARQRSTPLEATAPSSWHSRPIPAYKKRRSSGSVGSVGRAGSDTEDPTVPELLGGHRVRGQSNPTSPPQRLPPFTFPSSPPRLGRSAPSSPPFPHAGSQSVPSLPLSPTRGGFKSLRRQSTDRQAGLGVGTGVGSSPELINMPVPRVLRRGPEEGEKGEESRKGTTETLPSSMSSSAYTDDTLGDDRHHHHHHHHDHDCDCEHEHDPEEVGTERTSLYSVSTDPHHHHEHERVEELEKIQQEQLKKLAELQTKLEEKMTEHEKEMEDLSNQKEDIEAELAASRQNEKELRAKDLLTSKQLITLEAEVSRLQAALDESKTAYQNLQKQYQEQNKGQSGLIPLFFLVEAEKYRAKITRKELEMKDSEAYLAHTIADAEKWKNSAEVAQQMIASLTAELEAVRNAAQALDAQKQENISLKETIDRLRLDLDELRNAKSASSNGISRNGTISGSLALEMSGLHPGQDGEEGDPSSEDGTVVGHEYGDEGVVQTVVTRKKLAKIPDGEEQTTEVKAYSEAFAQHTASDFALSESSQTEPEPVPVTQSIVIQTEAKKLPEAQAAQPSEPSPPPPSYHLLEEEREKIGTEELARWHSGIHSLDPLPGGISSDAVEEWNHVKDELGVTCRAIDEIVERSEVRGPRAVRERERVPAEPEQSFFTGLRGSMGVLVGATIFGLIVFSTGRALHPGGLTRDQRLWAIYNDVARAGLMDGWLTHAAVAPAWAVLRGLNPAEARLGWVPT
ncbi:uncharacterized protein EI90DRAFT_3017385 [Cantharellus anzutake]|uniref:uncharacterized protein n=1 Tax=Cantharellus anzutake TaxID=1750568 RepID=UPI00190477F8|nr:uncharacterized protein EI90DRAFT_3017385 [Cantharellus anzutake]KAF8329149.1 hypothetical protein EI90DRAFT_3017385 [Cantharellus anzutake]